MTPRASQPTFWLVLLSLLFSGCTSTPVKEQPMVGFMMDGGANGNFSSVKHFIIFDDETIWHAEEERIKRYVSYLLSYAGLPEVETSDEADYLVFVNYIDESGSESREAQQLALTAVSKRVFNATGEVRPSWASVSRHYGVSPAPNQMLPMHTLSIRDFVGKPPNPYQKSMGYRVGSPSVLKLMNDVEGTQSNVHAPNNK